MELTPKELHKVRDWIFAHTYTGSSHQAYGQGNPAWLRADEMQEYLPELIKEILEGRKL